MEERQFIECVTERDIDLLVLEELHVSPAFAKWFFEQTCQLAFDGMQFWRAEHSVVGPGPGESDLIAHYHSDPGETFAILIENKITAEPQPQQGERYRSRGELGVRTGAWSQFRTCMIAPNAYLGRTSDAAEYDSRISYESIRDWFVQSGPTDIRSTYRARMIAAGIEQNRRGYQHRHDPAVTDFWLKYWLLANAEGPELGMKQPGLIAIGSDWPTFPLPTLRGRRIVHKLARGAVDLEFSGESYSEQVIRTQSLRFLGKAAEVVQTGKSLSVRLRVPVLDRTKEFALQIGAAREGLVAAQRLLELAKQFETAAEDRFPTNSARSS
jgi:hypothetical protein